MRTIIAVLAVLLSTQALAQSDRQLVDRFDRAETAGQYERALDAAIKVTERYPESAHWAFNAGRLHAKLGQLDEAIAQLTRCADLGYTGIASFEQHAHLDPLRDRDDFKDILERVRANAAERMAEFQAEAHKHEPPTYIPDPSEDGTKPPLVIALHGTGGEGEGMLEALESTCKRLGIICVAPDALRPAGRSPESGYSWTYRDESAWFVEHLIRQAIENHNADPDRVYLVGFSQGANIALVMAHTHQDTIAAAIPICGHYEPGIASGDAPPVPTYLLTGSRDQWKRTYTKAKSDFEAAGTETLLRVVNGMGHQMASPRELERALEWCLERSVAP